MPIQNSIEVRCRGETPTRKLCPGIVKEHSFDTFVCRYCYRRYSLAEVQFMLKIDESEKAVEQEKYERQKEKTRENNKAKRAIGVR